MRLPCQGRREEAERGVPELAQPRALRRPRVVSGIVEAPTAPESAADAPTAGAAVPVLTVPLSTRALGCRDSPPCKAVLHFAGNMKTSNLG